MTELLQELQEVIRDGDILSGRDISERYQHDWSAEAPGVPLAVLRPGSTQEVSSILQICNRHGQKVVVQGGLTGLCGGANPRGNELALSLEKMNGIEEVDRASMSMTVKAGTALQQIQEAAEQAGFSFPLDLGARGSCQIGGNIATNAGGNQVLRYGMMRQLVLGLEVVLADGSIISSMNKMLKNNAAFDLKHLFIGSEGSLGVITRAVLRLYPLLQSRHTALLALPAFTQAPELLFHLNRQLGGSLGAFEVMLDSYFDFILGEVDKLQSPFAGKHSCYVLVEMQGNDESKDRLLFEDALAAAMEEGLVEDAVLAGSERERQQFWQIRDGVGDIGGFMRDAANFDIGVPISSMEAFLDRVRSELDSRFPGITILVFGHLADSNMHLLCHSGRHEDIKSIYAVVYRLVGEFKGTVSAEHGIGVQKLGYLDYSRNSAELALMNKLKDTLDPGHILNEGRVLLRD